MSKVEKAQALANATITNHKIMNAVMKVKTEKTLASLNRIARFHTCPTYSDVEIGIEELKRLAKSNLLSSVRRINFICGEIKRQNGTVLIKPLRNPNGSYKKPEEMTNEELLYVLDSYRELDWLIKASVDEFAKEC